MKFHVKVTGASVTNVETGEVKTWSGDDLYAQWDCERGAALMLALMYGEAGQ